MQQDMMKIESIDRYFSLVGEDTYMPLLQVFILVPLLTKHLNSQNLGDFSTAGEAFKGLGYIGTLFFHLWSISTSILSHSNAATAVYFTQPKKVSLGEKLTTRGLFQISNLLQITSRITTITIFGTLLWRNNEFTPLYLVAMCLSHIIVVCLSKLSVRFLCKSKESKINIVLSAFASVYTNIKGDFIMIDTNEGTSNAKSPLNSSFKEKMDAIEERYQQKHRELKAKFMDRVLFSTLVWIEQITMMVMIGILGNSKRTTLNILVFLPVTFALYFLGHLCEWILLVFFSPVVAIFL